ncbi:AraC family transcriptional regulator [Undibacterium squillarum]|uniref:HTH-type transcriptional regulator YbcM n=1 Tax=Undibacterium squillarum TaxID=1131567 RepID=A0ABQ2XWE0_9BURK|nr:AraC family transcriptional regulator [Undibacterium squillarum]GGX36715.1 putative HTH-type transcriptional regulator YbcM [Undibacterium squillarum]
MMAVSTALDFYHARQVQSLRSIRFAEPALCFVRRGEKRLSAGQHNFQAAAGEWLILPANTPLMMENCPEQGQYAAEVLSISHEIASTFLRYAGADLALTPAPANADTSLHIKTAPLLAQAWEKLAQAQQPGFPPLLARHYLFEVLMVAALYGNVQALLNPPAPGLADKVRQLLQSSPAADWVQADVAKHFHMSTPTLRRHLAAEQQTFRDILDDVRMHHALHYVLSSRKNMDWIAGECGFTSPAAFSTRFRQRFGMAPASLRKTC